MAAVPASAQTWVGGVDTNWNNPGNWNNNMVPPTSANVIFSGNPTHIAVLPASPSTTKLRSISYDSTSVDVNLGNSAETIALVSTNPQTPPEWDIIDQESGNSQTINALILAYYPSTFGNGRVATLKLGGAGLLTLNGGLEWGMSGGGSNNLLVISGPGSLLASGPFRGDLTQTGSTGGTVKDVRLDGDAASGSTITFNPSSWTSVGNVILSGRVTLNLANVGPIGTGSNSFQFNSAANDASLFITGAAGSTFSRNITFNSITGGTQTIGVNLPSPGSATISSSLAATPANLNLALSAGSGSNAEFTGQITGTRPIAITGTGIVTVSNTTSSYAGTMTVNPNATLAGTGTGNSTTLIVNGTISPGDNVTAQLSTAAQTWNGGGAYKWEINDTTGSAGQSVGWDKVSFTTLSILADTANKFTVRIVGNPANFNSAISYVWTIASALTPGGISGFDPAKFVLDDSGFTHSTAGRTFGIQQVGDNLNITFTPGATPEPGSALLILCGTLALAHRRRR